MQGRDVVLSPEAARLAATHSAEALEYRLAYASGQRLCFVGDEGTWREALVLQPPVDERSTHLLRVFSGSDSSEAHVDLAMHSHAALPLYAYAAGHPLEVLEQRGHWRECVVVNRAPGSNQYVVRMGPTGNQFWMLLLPWNHRSLSAHTFVPLFACRGFVPAKWGDDALLEAIGEGDEGADRLEKPEEEDFDETSTIEIEHGKLVEFVLNIRSAQRGRALSLWCPGQVVAIHKRQFGTAVLKPGLGMMGKTCDVVAGSYRFSEQWANDDQPLLVRCRIDPPADEAIVDPADAAAEGAAATPPRRPPHSTSRRREATAAAAAATVSAALHPRPPRVARRAAARRHARRAAYASHTQPARRPRAATAACEPAGEPRRQPRPGGDEGRLAGRPAPHGGDAVRRWAAARDPQRDRG